MKIKQRPEDFVVREGYRFEPDLDGPVWVYRMDKQKVSTLQALERISKEFAVRRRDLSVCGLKDKQGRTEQLVGVLGGALGDSEVVQSGDLRLKLIGRAARPLSSRNITANRFEVTVRDLSGEEADRVPESAAEVERAGVANYFDSQRFGFLKHGQGFIARHLLRGDWESALKAFLATPSELDRSDDAKVKAFWRDHWGEWQLRAPNLAAKRYAPILRRLREDPRDFKGAFLHIDRRLRMMALFELQSFLWNEGVKRYLGMRIPAAELIGLRYQAGALVFPRSLTRELRDDLWNRTFPLLAPDSVIDDARVRDAALWALRTQGLTLEQLRVPDSPLFFKHEERPLFVRPGKLRVHPPRPDELNRGRRKVNLSFTLPPGAYATLVVRRVLWFATESARPVLRSSTPEAAPSGRGPPPERERPAAQPQGFLARQRARKAARAAHRAAARNPRNGR
ncbi:MAG TPA: tRNA pseudouridine(13) synthase TruD [Myxococcales bacterium]|nr:tRNA pseudouridine(13) synthase TruD [Myxococcales bacterium]